MTPRTQGVVLAVLGGVLIRLALTDAHLRFVTPWMRWPLVVAGGVLLLLAVRPLLHAGDRGGPDSGARAPGSTWLLLVPMLVLFVVAPPPLGAYLAERRAGQPVALSEPAVVGLPDSRSPLLVSLGEFAWGAAQPGDPMRMKGKRVRLSGFVSKDEAGWYLTQLEIFCCAADAMVVRVRVDGADAPPRDQWVEVVGTWVEGTGADPEETAVVAAESVAETDSPVDVYG